MIARTQVYQVPFDVGRPILRTMETHASLSLGPDKPAIIALPTFADDKRPVFVLVQAREQDPLTSPGVQTVCPAARKRARTTTPPRLFP